MEINLVGKNILLEEFLTNRYDEEGNIYQGDNGICLDAISFKEWGYEHVKFGLPSRDKDYINECLKNCINKEISEYTYLDTKENIVRDYNFQEPWVYQSTSTETLMKQLYKIEGLGIKEIEGQTNEEYKVYYFFSNLIYEINNMSVKVPIKSISSSGDYRWTYEYLIFPNFRVNEETLDKVRKISKDDSIELNISLDSGVNIDDENQRNDLYRLFSTSLHNLLQTEFSVISSKAKSIVNAIRLREHDIVVDSEFYDIHQNSRLSKRDSIPYTGYIYQGDTGLEKELSFREYLEMIGTDLKEITSIASDREKFMDFLEDNKKNPIYDPAIMYMQNLDNPFEALEVYEMVERERCYIRKLKYQHNMTIADNMSNFLSYIDFYQPGLSYSQNIKHKKLLESILWERGDHLEGYKKKTYRPRNNSSKKVRGF